MRAEPNHTEKRAELLIEHWQKQLREARERRLYLCPQCQCRAQIRNVDLQAEIHYVPPRGCTEGDYWTRGKKPTYLAKCPGCDHVERIHSFHASWEFVHKYHTHFKNCTEIERR